MHIIFQLSTEKRKGKRNSSTPHRAVPWDVLTLKRDQSSLAEVINSVSWDGYTFTLLNVPKFEQVKCILIVYSYSRLPVWMVIDNELFFNSVNLIADRIPWLQRTFQITEFYLLLAFESLYEAPIKWLSSLYVPNSCVDNSSSLKTVHFFFCQIWRLESPYLDSIPVHLPSIFFSTF